MNEDQPAIALYSQESEEALIGSVLINPSVFWDIDIDPLEFYIHKHQWIWSAFKEIREAGFQIDVINVTEHLDKNGKLSEAGGVAYLSSIINVVPSSLHAHDYARHIRETAYRRQTLDYANRLAKIAYDGTNDIIGERSKIARWLTDVHGASGAVHISEWTGALFDQIDEWSKNPQDVSGIPTGFVDVDKVLGDGILPGINLIGGAPGKGKSILVQNIAENAVAKGHTGALYTPELRKIDFSLRVLSRKTDIPVSRYRKGQVGDNEWSIITHEIEKINKLPFFVDDPRRMTTGELRADLTRLKIQHEIQWVIFDYLELLADRYSGVDKWQRSEMLVRELIYIARELDLPMLIVQKLSKSGWDGKPSMEDFSGGSDVLYDVTSASILTDHIAANGDKQSDNMRTLVSVKPQRLIEQTLAACNLYKKSLVPVFENSSSGMYPAK